MAWLRRALAPIAAMWLLCQSAALVGVPAFFWDTSIEALECTCAHGDHAMCPMHHKPAPGKNRCFMRGAGDDAGTAVLDTMLTGIGVMPGPVRFIGAPASTPIVFAFDATANTFGSSPPDPPPPRA